MREPPRPKMTLPLQLVLATLLAEPTKEMYGLEIGRQAGLASGTVHPILARLDGLGWLESRWEILDPHEEGRPRRRYYRLTADGAQRALAALAKKRTPMPLFGQRSPGLAGGSTA